DLLPDATFILDKDEKIIGWNRGMEELTNIKTKDMIGK
ncbi:MAG: PAS domain-containing protein, partial [Candidatus Thorarchaeota archaeon]